VDRQDIPPCELDEQFDAIERTWTFSASCWQQQLTAAEPFAIRRPDLALLINNSELDLPNMWIAYLPMFIGVYVVTQWLDKKLGD
jgi:hypothetical protein